MCACHRFKARSKNLLGLALSDQSPTVPASEFLDTARRVDELLLTSEKRMAGGADFHADVPLVDRTGDKCIPASAMHANFAVMGMNSWFHVSS